jgi:hypothetical protein
VTGVSSSCEKVGLDKRGAQGTYSSSRYDAFSLPLPLSLRAGADLKPSSSSAASFVRRLWLSRSASRSSSSMKSSALWTLVARASRDETNVDGFQPSAEPTELK